ncbi:phage integrase N-terminal SAM-like domain-containing protein [Leptothermofonsia sichuanensis E412]|nr:phage integrase N-terminal SAM-like domain-containing protein [Leptothermofonsia sichuanensis E412]
MTDRPKMLLEVVQETLRRKHYSFRTEKTYLQWIKRYLLFHNKRHPSAVLRKLFCKTGQSIDKLKLLIIVSQ